MSSRLKITEEKYLAIERKAEMSIAITVLAVGHRGSDRIKGSSISLFQAKGSSLTMLHAKRLMSESQEKIWRD